MKSRKLRTSKTTKTRRSKSRTSSRRNKHRLRGGEKVLPRQLGTNVIENIHIYMETILAELPASARRDFVEWKSLIKDNDSEWIYIVKDELSKLSEKQINEMLNSFSKYSPSILYSELKRYFADYYKKRTGIKTSVKKGMDIEVLKLFLAYTIVVEAPVDDYVSRVNGFFGW